MANKFINPWAENIWASPEEQNKVLGVNTGRSKTKDNEQELIGGFTLTPNNLLKVGIHFYNNSTQKITNEVLASYIKTSLSECWGSGLTVEAKHTEELIDNGVQYMSSNKYSNYSTIYILFEDQKEGSSAFGGSDSDSTPQKGWARVTLKAHKNGNLIAREKYRILATIRHEVFTHICRIGHIFSSGSIGYEEFFKPALLDAESGKTSVNSAAIKKIIDNVSNSEENDTYFNVMQTPPGKVLLEIQRNFILSLIK